MDSPLTEVGMRQAHLLSRLFTEQDAKIDKVISSPYLRAIESIKPFAERNNLDVNVDDRLKERIISEEPVDDWMEVLEQSFSDPDFKLPGGESSNDAITRVESLIATTQKDNNVSNVILVSHGNLIALLLTKYKSDFGFNGWKNLHNPDVFLIDFASEKQQIESLWNTHYK